MFSLIVHITGYNSRLSWSLIYGLWLFKANNYPSRFNYFKHILLFTNKNKTKKVCLFCFSRTPFILKPCLHYSARKDRPMVRWSNRLNEGAKLQYEVKYTDKKCTFRAGLEPGTFNTTPALKRRSSPRSVLTFFFK